MDSIKEKDSFRVNGYGDTVAAHSLIMGRLMEASKHGEEKSVDMGGGKIVRTVYPVCTVPALYLGSWIEADVYPRKDDGGPCVFEVRERLSAGRPRRGMEGYSVFGKDYVDAAESVANRLCGTAREKEPIKRCLDALRLLAEGWREGREPYVCEFLSEAYVAILCEMSESAGEKREALSSVLSCLKESGVFDYMEEEESRE